MAVAPVMSLVQIPSEELSKFKYSGSMTESPEPVKI